MSLTLNQFLLLVAAFALVVAVVFLVRLFIQLRRTSAEGEKTLVEIRDLARHLKELDLVVKERVEDLGKTLEASKKAAASLSEASLLVTSKIIRPSSQYLPLLLPAIRFFWRRFRKRKEKSHGE
jgi:hypothetical protein